MRYKQYIPAPTATFRGVRYWDAAAVVQAIDRAVEHQEQRIDQLEEFLESVQRWTEAYPEDIFPVPDWEVVRNALRPLGSPNNLDCVSAANMRKVVDTLRGLLDELGERV